jgi:hypothetical protein
VGEVPKGWQGLPRQYKRGEMMDMLVIKDRRSFLRFNCSHLASYIRFDLEGRQCEEEKVRTMDISPDGLRIQTYSNLSVDEVLDLTVAIREKLFNARGKVIHCEPSADGRFNVGISFLNVDENDLHILYNYFQDILGSKG